MGFFSSGSRQSRQEGGKTIIAKGCSFSGEITEIAGALHIDGHVEGVIDSAFDVSIGETGSVSGLVKAKRIALSGTLEGKVACETIDILSTGKLIGELICGEFTVETGGKFIGQSHEMTEGGMVVSLPETFEQMGKKPVMSQLAKNAKRVDSDEVVADIVD
ncbi:MAG: polymer-forming cytoskeletal protein [Gammaproteobacteria bacterium]|nr:polymer-forming cytoskeletal protein [Gammaproteobacteria bacterium]